MGPWAAMGNGGADIQAPASAVGEAQVLESGWSGDSAVRASLTQSVSTGSVEPQACRAELQQGLRR